MVNVGAAQLRLLVVLQVPSPASVAARSLDLWRKLAEQCPLRLMVVQAAFSGKEVLWELAPAKPSRPGAELLTLAELVGWLRRERIEAVHALDGASARWAVPAARLAGCKVIMNRAGFPLDSGGHRHQDESALSRAADLVVASSSEVMEQLTGLEGVPAERVVMVPPGFDLTQWDARVNDSAAMHFEFPGAARAVVVSADQDREGSGMEDFLTALALCRARHPEVFGAIVGRGRNQARLEVLASTLGISDRVAFLGERTDLPALYGRALAAVVLGDGNPNLLAALEPMASGCPALVPSGTEAALAVGVGKRGQTFRAQQPALLSRCLAVMLKDPTRARALGRAARSHVEHEHGAPEWLASHQTLYARLSASRVGRDGKPEPLTGGTYGQFSSGPNPDARER